MRKVSSLLFTIIFIFSCTLNSISFNSLAGLLTTVTVDTETLTEVDVSPDSTGSAIVKGNVTCQNANIFTPLMVSLSIESTIGNATLDKTTIIFQGTHQAEEISIEITIPLLTSATEDHSCTVFGIWQQGGTSGSVVPDTFQIIILPVYLITISYDSPKKEITQGESVNFILQINNSGNIDDIYNIYIAEKNKLEERGITIQIIDEISIGEQEFEEVKVAISTSIDTSPNDYKIPVIFTSTRSDELVEIEFILKLKVKESILGLDNISISIILIIIVIIIVFGIFMFIKRRLRND